MSEIKFVKEHSPNLSASGKFCGICQRIIGVMKPATHKIEEVTWHIELPRFSYVCCSHFGDLMGPDAQAYCDSLKKMEEK